MNEKTKTPIQDLFESWCSKKSYQIGMKKPFEQSRYVYATDSNKVIRCLIGDYYGKIQTPSANPPNAHGLFEKAPSSLSPLGIDFNELETLKSEDEFNKPKEVDCEECDGHGTVEWEYKGHERSFDCPECNGRGVISTKGRKKTGRKIFGEYDSIQIDGVLFNANLFMSLKDVFDLTQSSLLVETRVNYGIYFESGVFEGIIMGQMPNEKLNIIKSITLTP